MPSRSLPSRMPALGAAVGVVMALLLGVMSAPPVRAQDADQPLLSMTIDDLDSATINGKGPLHISGTVTNDDSEAWDNVDIYPFLGTSPITTESDLAEQAALPEDAAVGERITQTGDYTTIDHIAPHQTLTWSLQVLRRDLNVTEPGVYWFGVHALLPNDVSGDVARADGRARTFLPLVPKQPKRAEPEKVAVVLPIRRRVLHQPDGRIANVARWTADLSDTGRLGRLLAFGGTSTQITWLLDPAVLDAVQRLAAGNPPRNLGPTQSGSGSPSPSASPSSSPSEESSTGGEEGELTPQQEADYKSAQHAATRWLDLLKAALPGHEVLALPYADPDLPAVAEHDARLYKSARERAKAVLDEVGIQAQPAEAPPTGYLDRRALRLEKDNPLNLVSDAMIRGSAPAAAQVGDQRLITTSVAAASGGPDPNNPLSPMEMRQRIVSEAALRLGSHRPLVVMLPDGWNPPGSVPNFFAALNGEPWLSLTSVVDATLDRPSRVVDPSRLVYPESEQKAQLPGEVFDKVRALIHAGNTLQGILPRNDTLGSEVLSEALTSASYAARRRGHGEAAHRSREVIDDGLDSVRVDAPSGVTLGGDNGGFSVTVSNDLAEPVAVHLRVVSDHGLRVDAPAEVPVPAGGRSTITLTAHATTNGVHAVRLVLTNADGVPLGNATELPIRSSQVSTIIWWFVGVGGTLLFVAIGVRLVRRVRAARRAARGSALATGAP